MAVNIFGTQSWYYFHYSDVIMSTMAPQINGVSIVCSTVGSGEDKTIKQVSKLRVTGLCAGNSPVTGEFPAQRPLTRKMFPFDDVIMHIAWYFLLLNMMPLIFSAKITHLVSRELILLVFHLTIIDIPEGFLWGRGRGGGGGGVIRAFNLDVLLFIDVY